MKLMPNVELWEEQVILKDDEITEIIHEERRIKEEEKNSKAKAEKRLSVIKQEDVNEDDEDLNL